MSKMDAAHAVHRLHAKCVIRGCDVRVLLFVVRGPCPNPDLAIQTDDFVGLFQTVGRHL
jgi:hypothetical protein